MEESAIFDAVVDVVIKGDYDYYIYDLVPLGHALYYLSMAKVYDEWINKVTKLREDMREYEEMVSRLKREKDTEEDEILTELLLHQGTHQRVLVHPDRQGQDRVLLRRHPGGHDHRRHGKGREAVRAVRRADRRVRGQSGRASRARRSEDPRLPAQPDRDAGQVPWEHIARRSGKRFSRTFRSSSAT